MQRTIPISRFWLVLIGLTLISISGLLVMYNLVGRQLPTLKMPSGRPTPKSESFPYTDFRRSLTISGAAFWDSFKPAFKCPSGLLSRVGSMGDGGKWMCGLETLGRRNTEDGRNCMLYSFGVNHDSSFEADVLKAARCSIYAYDPTVNEIGHPLKTNTHVHFQKVGISGNDTATRKTLKTLMKENGHEFIEILKADVEGAEYESLENIFQDFNELPVGQLLIEFHSWSFKETPFPQVLSYFERLENKGTRIFSVEANHGYPQYCAELSFINLKYIKLFLPDYKE